MTLLPVIDRGAEGVRMLRLGWFSTGRDEAARHLLTAVWQAIERGELAARIAFVFCNRERGEHPETDRFLELAESYGLPLVCLSHEGYRRARGLPPVRVGPASGGLPAWRLDYDRAAIEFLKPYPFDLGVLAGYMLIVGPEMCRLPLINLHPALPGGPTGTWQEVIWQLLEERAERAGVTIHVVTEELDRGPPVSYCAFPLRGPAFDLLWRELDELGLERARRQQGEQNLLFREVRRPGGARGVAL